MLGIPLQCAMFLTRHKVGLPLFFIFRYSAAFIFQGLLLQCNSNKSSYLFQSDKFYDVRYDIGDKTYQCGRKNDVLKLWLTWKGRGKANLTASVENAFAMAAYFNGLIRDREGFHLVLPEVRVSERYEII